MDLEKSNMPMVANIQANGLTLKLMVKVLQSIQMAPVIQEALVPTNIMEREL